MNNDNITKGYASLSAACSATGITPGGAGFLAKTFDGFQDVPTAQTGIPDGPGVKTIVREFRQTASISVASFTPALTGTSWTLNVGIMPIVTGPISCLVGRWGCITDSAELLNGFSYGPGFTAYEFNIGSFTLMATTGDPRAPGGATQLWPDCTMANSTQYGAFASSAARGNLAFSPAADFLQTNPIVANQGRLRSWRVVAQSFELHNTTNELNVGGSVSVYRSNTVFDRAPGNLNHWAVPGAPGTGIGHQFLTDCFQVPANDVTNVTNLPGTRSWEARQGVYVNAALDTESMCKFVSHLHRNPACGLNYADFYDTTRAIVDLDRVILTSNFTPFIDHAGHAQEYFMPRYVPLSAVQTGGCIFSELPITSTFRLEMRITIEYVPLYCDPDIVIAPPPGVYDPEALVLYHRTVRDMPAGCPVTMNAAGDWFRSIMDLVLSKASVIGGGISTALIGSPAPGAMVGLGVNAAWRRATAGQKRAF